MKEQILKTLRLAVPVIITQVGQMSMGLVDTFMVGKLGARALGCVSIGSAVFFIFTMFAIGLISGLDHFISKAMGEKNQPEADKWLLQGLYFALVISVPLTVLTFVVGNNLAFFGVPADTAAGAKSFLLIFNLSVLPFMVFFSQRQYLQSTGSASLVTTVTLVGNALNILMNYIFIYGHWGAPPMGIQGAALSTLINRSVMASVLVYLTFKKVHLDIWTLDFPYFKKMIRLGWPASLQNLFEIGVFTLSTFLASRLDPYSLAAHSIVLNIASLTFMVPLGVSMAAAIRVGRYLGEGQKALSYKAGYGALMLGFGFMAFFGILLTIFGRQVIGFFTIDPQVVDIGYRIVLIAAVFQVADGIQVVATGALRGLGETRFSAFTNLIGHWAVGLPVGIYLCFYRNLKLTGLWTGLSLGLFVVAATLFVAWVKKDRLLLSTPLN